MKISTTIRILAAAMATAMATGIRVLILGVAWMGTMLLWPQAGRAETAKAAESVEARDSFRLERRVIELERTVRDLERRMRSVEDHLRRGGQRPPGTPPEDPIPEVRHFCMLTESGPFADLFLGSGLTRMDAEYEAEQNCLREIGSEQNCRGSGVGLKCDSTLADPLARSFVCIVVESSAFQDRHRGEGLTAVAAEFEARRRCGLANGGQQDCQGPARCEGVY